ncbi:OS9 [Mytilus edulis]|uniref:OS9 n=1 Tax=Mytilus edulis TaxID=6550 RepID=A0A8S3PLY9_MYTED|nr:OS9 [Mytilus edulis]
MLDIEEINNVNYGIDILKEPVLLKPEVELPVNHIHLTSKYGQRYQCHFPDQVETVRKTEEKEKEALETGIPELLKPLESVPCLLKAKDWWSYEFCYGKYIRQFHIEDGKILGDIVYLGYYDSEKDWSEREESYNKLNRYHSQSYVNGSKCDLTGDKRKTEVRPIHTSVSSRFYTSASSRIHTSVSSRIHTSPSSKIHTSPSSKIHTSPSSKIYTSPSSKIHTSASCKIHTSPSSKIHTSASCKIHTSPSSKIYTSLSSKIHTSPSSKIHTSVSSRIHISPSSKIHTSASSKIHTSTSSKIHTSVSSRIHTSPSSKILTSPSTKINTSPSSKIHTSASNKMHTSV